MAVPVDYENSIYNLVRGDNPAWGFERINRKLVSFYGNNEPLPEKKRRLKIRKLMTELEQEAAAALETLRAAMLAEF